MNNSMPASDQLQGSRRSGAIRWLISNIHLAPVAWALFSLQFLALAIFAVYQYHRFSLTQDFSAYYQAWYLIAHGHLNPPETAFMLNHFWRDHFALVMWVLAPLYWVWPHAVTLLWIQDAAIVGSEIVVWNIAQLMWTRHNYPVQVRGLLNAALLILLIANPWIYWGVAFDFHPYSIGALTVSLSLFAFYQQKNRWGYGWALCTLLGGDVVATYLLGIGITLFILGPKGQRYRGWIVVAIPVVFLAIYSIALNHHSGSSLPKPIPTPHPSTNVGFLNPYSYIAGPHVSLSVANLAKGFVEHPTRWLAVLWNRRVNLWANVAAPGFCGLFSPWGLGVPLVILAQTFLPAANTFSTDFSQMLAVYALITLGTVTWIGKLAQRQYVVGVILAGLVAANAIGWAIQWVPEWPLHWVSVSANTAQTLSQVEQNLPKGNEVVASQGIMGRFSGRRWIYPFSFSTIPLETPVTDIIVSPYQGVNTLSVAAILERLAALTSSRNAVLIEHRDNIWVFRYRRAPGQTVLSYSGASSVPGWALASAAGVPVTVGPRSQWHMAAAGNAGYVTSQAYWRLPQGWYRVHAHVATNGPINIEVWNATGSVLIVRKTISLSSGVTTASLVFHNQKQYPSRQYKGWGPFRLVPSQASPYNAIEVRIWSPGKQTVNVYRIGITALRSAGRPS